MSNLANILTFMSLVCGFISLVFSLEGHFTFAAWAIILSVIFDGLDGQVARRNPVPSNFGKEFDSLVDVVAFGVAPAILGYLFIYRDFHLWGTLALLVYLSASVVRLAKYNITGKEEMANYFYGLPTTASGALLAGFILMFRKENFVYSPKLIPYLFLTLVLLLSYLMLSRIKYLNLDGLKNILGKNTKVALFSAIIIFILAALFKKAGVITFTVFAGYLILSPLLVRRRRL
ncbi:MAG: CDP-diacylglycerol--serine O-phosphatidyltransferase [Candidatus Omnitrophota bacterium]